MSLIDLIRSNLKQFSINHPDIEISMAVDDITDINKLKFINSYYFDHNPSGLFDSFIKPIYQNDFAEYIGKFDLTANQILKNVNKELIFKNLNLEKSNQFYTPLKYKNEAVIYLINLAYFLRNEKMIDPLFVSKLVGKHQTKIILWVVVSTVFKETIKNLNYLIEKNQHTNKKDDNLATILRPQKKLSGLENTAREALNHIFEYAIENKAADVTIAPSFKDNGTDYTFVYHSIDGDTIKFDPEIYLPAELHTYVIRALQDLCHIEMEDRIFKTVDARFNYFEKDWRACFLPCGVDNKIAVTCRLLDKKSVEIPIEKIYLNTAMREDLEKAFKRHKEGFILVTGKTGSGKSTSLYSALYHLNFNVYREKRKIMTIEDPIEYKMAWMHQHQVTRVNTPNEILNGFLRSGPDVIFVGEIRDEGMLEPSRHAANSGHLCFATMHTGSVFETVLRMKRYGVSTRDIADSVVFIINQKLCKTLCKKCRIKVEDSFYTKGIGCANCRHTGETGRTCVSEYLYNDPGHPDIYEALLRGEKRLINQVIDKYFLSLDSHLLWSQKAGLIDCNIEF